MTFQFDSLLSFMTMSGHGPFVWSAYGITFAALLYLVINPLLQRRQFFSEQQRLQRIARK